MKLLITGTNGFVGRNLKEHFSGAHELATPKRGDLNLLDSEAVHAYVKAGGFDAVIHCAVNIQSVEQTLMMYFNVERCAPLVGKMLCVGSAAEYDMRHYVPMMREDYFGRHVPCDVYGFSKYVIAKDIEAGPRNVYNLRVFGIYGPYEDHRRRFISNNICRVLCGLGMSMNKNMLFDYLYVKDFARIVDLFLRRDPLKRSYNVCTGRPVDLLTLAGMINAVHGGGVPVVVKEPGMKPEYSGDNSLFLGEFGDFDFTPPETAIESLYRWYQDPKNIALNAQDYA